MSAPVVYELNVRCFLADLSRRLGRPAKLGDVPSALVQDWASLGFTHIWAMGVWEVGPLSREAARKDVRLASECATVLPDLDPADVLGSPYAIQDYRVAELLGGEGGLETFRNILGNNGLKLILDFIPNHTGLDHPWLTDHPEWYVQARGPANEFFEKRSPEGICWIAHGKDPNFAAWADTAQLDYRRPEVHVAMTRALVGVATKCDGVRCDMAMLMLSEVFNQTWRRTPPPEEPLRGEFWRTAIQNVRECRPDFLFLGEVYWGLESVVRGLGFDYVYDKGLYDLMVARRCPEVQRHLLEQGEEQVGSSAHFLENHDEVRIASRLELGEHRAAALLVLGLPGMRLLHEGQLEGARIRVPVQLARRPSEVSNPEVEGLYRGLLTALQRTAVGRGSGKLLAPRAAWAENQSWRNFVIVQWQEQAPGFDLVVVNESNARSQCYVPLSVEGLENYNWRMEDLLGDERYDRHGDDLRNQGLYLDVGPHGAQLFHLRPI